MIFSKTSTVTSSSSPKSFDRALGFIISLAGGASLYVLHAWLQSLRRRKRHHVLDTSKGSDERSTGTGEKKASKDTDAAEGVGRDTAPAADQCSVLHTGSCHCGRFHFHILAPPELCAVQYAASRHNKLRYPRLTLPAVDFEILSDIHSSLSLYSVIDHWSQGSVQGQGQVGIHAFCSFCGMQVLYSPPPPADAAGGTSEVVVNADCLDRANIRKLHVAYGGVRDMPPCAVQTLAQAPTLEGTQPSEHNRYMREHSYRHQQSHHSLQYQHSSQHISTQDNPHQRMSGGSNRERRRSDDSDSTTTRGLTLSSEEEEEEGDIMVEGEDDARGPAPFKRQVIGRERGGGGGDRKGRDASVNLLHHLVNENSGEQPCAYSSSRQQWQPQQPHPPRPQHQYQQQKLSSNGSLLGMRLRLEQQQHDAHIRLDHPQTSALDPGDLRKVLSPVVQQPDGGEGNSPSLYETLPLMYSYASTTTSPLDKQQSTQHVPVVIRSSELMAHRNSGSFRDLNDAFAPAPLSLSSIAPSSLHHRLKLYLQQHLDEAGGRGGEDTPITSTV